MAEVASVGTADIVSKDEAHPKPRNPLNTHDQAAKCEPNRAIEALKVAACPEPAQVAIRVDHQYALAPPTRRRVRESDESD